MLPKISCLTATRNRLAQLKESIRNYCAQTYPNREMIIVTEAGERYCRAIADYFATLGSADYRLVALDGGDHTLGQIRNISLEAAAGDIVCQWDDDDQYHPRRLEVQAQRMFDRQAECCCLTDQLQFFWRTREMYWTDWTIGGYQDWQRLVPGTLMMYRDKHFRYPASGPLSRRGEDSALLAELASRKSIAELPDAGYLYVYIYHHDNTFEESHHRRISRTHARDEVALRRASDTLGTALGYYNLPLPYTVRANSGHELFTYGGVR